MGRGKPKPMDTWQGYCDAIGDRSPMFRDLATRFAIESALYPGSYLDLSPSTAIPSVTYVDTDRRARKYFADSDRVQAELAAANPLAIDHEVRFLPLDYMQPLPLPDERFDLLISLYAGPFWDTCRRYLKPGGFFLANSSHGDASLAALDRRLRLAGVVKHEGDEYSLTSDHLEGYLIPKKPDQAHPDPIRTSGRGIAYTRQAFAYLFQMQAER